MQIGFLCAKSVRVNQLRSSLIIHSFVWQWHVNDGNNAYAKNPPPFTNRYNFSVLG